MRAVLIALACLFALAAPVAMAPPAVALEADLAEAKSDGLIGERPDGLVAAVSSSPSSAIEQLVAKINQKRMAEYRQIAERTGTPVKAVQARAGRTLIQNLSSGQYFQDAAGRWRQK